MTEASTSFGMTASTIRGGLQWLTPRASREGQALVIVEGELNALSIAKACPELAVVSPGGAGDFSSKTAKKCLRVLVSYSTILIVADADAPGAKAIIDCYAELAGRGCTVKTLLMPVDANEMLEKSGAEALRQEIKRAMGEPLETSTESGSVSF
jgi:DNA primase